MIHLDLTTEEQEVLKSTLESYLSDLRYEIADTDAHDFREQLKARKAVLEKILDAVRNGS
ncbi:MAG TPA: hypothetical protein ENK48_01235 [Gammaproteobacteria bacterium]|nr:hypothetical protein [Gammaproteobacteria bacterium]